MNKFIYIAKMVLGSLLTLWGVFFILNLMAQIFQGHGKFLSFVFFTNLIIGIMLIVIGYILIRESLFGIIMIVSSVILLILSVIAILSSPPNMDIGIIIAVFLAIIALFIVGIKLV
jgi:hypothetical protein